MEMSKRMHLPGKVKKLLEEKFGPAEGSEEPFACETCTKCCETLGKEIILTLSDIHRLSRHFNQTMPETFEQHLQIYGVPLFMISKFLPHTEGDIPLAIQIPMPCGFLHEDYQSGREENCTINNAKPGICLQPPLLFYDLTITKELCSFNNSPGLSILLENILDYPCVQNKHAPVEEVLQAKAFMDLHEREFNYTLKTLYQPRIILENEIARQIIDYVEYNKHSSWYKDSAEKIMQTARYWDDIYDKDYAVFMKILAREIHKNFKEVAINRLQQIEQNPQIIQKLEKYSKQYLTIRNGQIPSHIKLVKPTQILQKKKIKRRR